MNTSVQLGGDGSRKSLIQAILDLASANNVAECRSVVEACPHLLTDQAETLLEKLLAEAKARGDRFAFYVRILQHRRKLLQQCREVGIEKGFERAIAANWLMHPPNGFDELVEVEKCERQYEETGAPEALDATITIWQHLLSSPVFLEASVDLQTVLLHNSAVAFARRFESIGNVEDIEAAIRSWECGLGLLSVDSPYRPLYLHSLSRGLEIRFRCTGDVSDLHRALAASEETLQLTPIDSVDRPGYLYRVGVCYRRLYEYAGDEDHLNHAITAHQNAIDVVAEEPDELPVYLNALGAALCTKFRQNGDVETLYRGIDVFRQAIQTSVANWSELPSCLHNLGGALLIRYHHTRETSDLDEAIDAHQQAVEITHPTSQNLPIHLASLGNALSDRYALTGNQDDLAQAITVCEKAASLVPAGSPERVPLLMNLSKALNDKYLLVGDRQVLQQQISLTEEAIRTLSSHSPSLPSCLLNFGITRKQLYLDSKNQNCLLEAVAAFESSCQAGLEQAPEVALESCRVWGAWASEREAWAEAGRAYGYGMAAIERLYRVQLTRRAKETWLREVRGLPARAGYTLARAGDLADAVLVLEQGRARLLAEVLERDRADLSALEQAHPAAYAAYRRAADRIFALSGQELRPADLPPDFDLVEAIRAARAELDAAIEAIRALPGHASFMPTPTFDDIQAALTPSPLLLRPSALVYLAVTPSGTVALVVTPAAVHPLHTPLTEDELREHIQGPADDPALGGYLGAYTRWLSAPRAERDAARQAWFAAFDHATHWLWDVLMGPLVQTLTTLDITHATLVPQGLLGLLPLHAAWTDTQPPEGSKPSGGSGHRRYALDHVTFSYAPSARALSAAQTTAAAAPGARLFAVDNPDGSLIFSRQEVDAVVSHFEGQGPEPWTARGPQATRNTTLHALPQCDVYHFSCHGSNAWNAPLESALWMYGHPKPLPLTVRDLLEQRGTQARLAFLSACETGLVGTALPDEVVGLASGFLQAGAAGVVSTLWAVNDRSTAFLAERFYHHWKGDGMAPADALASAQRWLRDEADDGHWSHPYYWAGFTLTGV